MAAASLANYDGSAGTLVDTNIWVDCIDEESPWREWAVEQLQKCSERSPLHVNLIIYTELLVPGPSVDALDALRHPERLAAEDDDLPEFHGVPVLTPRAVAPG